MKHNLTYDTGMDDSLYSKTPYLTSNTTKGSSNLQNFNLSLGNWKYALKK